MKKDFIDNVLSVVSPQRALRRMENKVRLDALNEVGKRGFQGAANSRHYSDFLAGSSSTNVEIQAAFVKLRNRSRELARNNPYIKKALGVMVNNTIGTGILPEPYVVQGKGDAARIKKVWKLWAENVQCDWDGKNTFYGLQSLILRTVKESGECLVIRRHASNKYKLPLRLQVLEGDFIDNSKFSLNNEYGGITWYGIEFNKAGERVGYWLWNRHPGEFATVSNRVDAKDILHIYKPDRPGQVRGIPEVHASMIRVQNLDDYEFSEQMRAKIAACMVGVIKQSDGVSNPLKADDFATMEPGTFQRMNPGEEVTFNSVPTSTGYPAYVSTNLHAIAAGMNITYEAMTGDMSQANFSQARMGWLEFNREVQHWQNNIIIPTLCNPVFDWFMEAAQVKGLLPLTLTAGCSWTPPRREMIDPYKEMKATELMLRLKVKSLQDVQREFGDHPEDTFAELKAEFIKYKAAGLMPESMPEFDAQRKDQEGGSRTDSAAMN